MPFTEFDGQAVHRGRIRFAGTQPCHRELRRDSEVVVLAVGTVAAVTHRTFDELLTRLHAIKVGEAYVVEVDYVAGLLGKLRAEASELAGDDEPRLPLDLDPPPPPAPPASGAGSALDQALAFAETSEAANPHPDDDVEGDGDDGGDAPDDEPERGVVRSPFSEQGGS